jgi:P27 family predicted phage terminase small subunit
MLLSTKGNIMSTQESKSNPEKLKVLEGGQSSKPEKRRKSQAKLAPGAAPPDWLNRIAKEHWKKTAPILERSGLFEEVDHTAFALYCDAYSRWRQALKAIQKEGLVYKGGRLLRTNPWVPVLHKATRQLRQFSVEFGMTPMSRLRFESKWEEGG